MDAKYCDTTGNLMTREDVYLLPPEKLAERSGIAVNIVPGYDQLYDSAAEVMIEKILEKRGDLVTMILPI